MAQAHDILSLYGDISARVGPKEAADWLRRQRAPSASARQALVADQIVGSRAKLHRAGEMLSVTASLLALATLEGSTPAPALMQRLVQRRDLPLPSALHAIFRRAGVNPSQWIDDQFQQLWESARSKTDSELPADVQFVFEVIHDVLSGALGERRTTTISWAYSFRYAVRKGRVISEMDVLQRFAEVRSRKQARRFLYRAAGDDALLAKLLELPQRTVVDILRGRATPAQLNEFDRATNGYSPPRIDPREFEPYDHDGSLSLAARRPFGVDHMPTTDDLPGNVVELFPAPPNKHNDGEREK